MIEQIGDEAKRIIAEESDGWEFRLTLEVLQSELTTTLQRWDALKRSLYSWPISRVPPGGAADWLQDRLADIDPLATTFSTLVNVEFGKAWGALGQPGDADAIVLTSRLFAELCRTALAWEEKVRFSTVDDAFEPARMVLIGVAGRLIEEAKKLPEFMSGVLNDPYATGGHSLNMVVKAPDDWLGRFQRALKTAESLSPKVSPAKRDDAVATGAGLKRDAGSSSGPSERLTRILRAKSAMSDAEIQQLSEAEGWAWVYQNAPKRAARQEQICFTGFNAVEAEELRAMAVDCGWLKVATSVTTTLEYLCVGGNAGPAKLEKAKRVGSVVLTRADFERLLSDGELPKRT